jgi:3D (Asp-Asp-Asp) domain-containing protein
MAAGGYICGRKDCIVANNALKLGSRVKIAGLGVCTVLDRLNERYNNQPDRFDLYLGMDVPAAVAWGVKERTYIVVE